MVEKTNTTSQLHERQIKALFAKVNVLEKKIATLAEELQNGKKATVVSQRTDSRGRPMPQYMYERSDRKGYYVRFARDGDHYNVLSVETDEYEVAVRAAEALTVGLAHYYGDDWRKLAEAVRAVTYHPTINLDDLLEK